MTSERTVIFFASAISQPRCIRRVEAMHNAGFKCVIYGYSRGYYDVNKYPEGVEVNYLSTLTSGGRYFGKFLTIYKDLRKITKSHPNAIIYSFGYIQSFICMILSVSYIYEISDIAYAYPKFKKVEAILRFFDILVINKALASVFTSEGFLRYFKKTKQKNIFVLPNKVSSKLKSIKRSPTKLEEKRIRFAFIGAIRYDSVTRFARVVGEHFPQHSFSFYGAATNKVIEQECKSLAVQFENIYYFGVYRNPDDLNFIYSSIDMTVACYDTASLNERLAEPNKLYESIFFCKPIIVSSNIFLAEKVEKLKCGYSIDASEESNIIGFIQNLKIDDINNISNKELLYTLDEIIDGCRPLSNFLNSL